MRRITLAAALLATLGITPASATASTQELDNRGKSFFFSFIENPYGGDMEVVSLFVTSEVATEVTLEYPASAPTLIETQPVVPGAMTTFHLPLSAESDWLPDSVNDNVAHIHSPEPVVATVMNFRLSSGDAALGLPVEVLNTDYIVADYQPGSGPSQFVVYAAHDDTTVTITPKNNLVGHGAGTPFDVVLQRGEVYQAQSQSNSGPTGSLTGTLISADRPVGLAQGSGCPTIPAGAVACDHVYEIARPVQSWGQTVLLTNVPWRPAGSIYRVLAAEPSTVVQLDGAHAATLDPGEFAELGPLPGNHVLTADHPIQVSQFITGQFGQGGYNGDPSMCELIPLEQFRTTHDFVRVEPNFFSSEWVYIVAADDDIGSLTLDGVPVDPALFQPIPGSGHSCARRPFLPGAHRTESRHPHAVYGISMGPAISYTYPAAAGCDFINPSGDLLAPTCTIDVAPDRTSAAGTASDGGGEDASGIFFVSLAEGATNLELTHAAFVPGEQAVAFTLDLIEPALPGEGTVRVTDGSGNTSTCDAYLAGSECFLAFGSGPGDSVFTPGTHAFTTQLADIRTYQNVSLANPAEIPIRLGTIGPAGTTELHDASGSMPWDVTVQLLMWNPIDFPLEPEQFSAGLHVSVHPDGTLTTRTFGTNNTGIEVRAEIARNQAGEPVLRFPFTIPAF